MERELLCDCSRPFHYYCIQKKCKNQNRRFCDQCMINHQSHKRWAIFNKLNFSISHNMGRNLFWIIKKVQNQRDKIIQIIWKKAHQIQQKDQNYEHLLAYLKKTEQKIQEAIQKHLLNDFITIYQNPSGSKLSLKIIEMINHSQTNQTNQTEIFKLIEKAQQLQKFYDQKIIQLDLKERYMENIIMNNLSKFRYQLMELLQDDQLLEIQIQKLKSLSPFFYEFTQKQKLLLITRYKQSRIMFQQQSEQQLERLNDFSIEKSCEESKQIKRIIERDTNNFHQQADQYREQYANKKKLRMKWTKKVQLNMENKALLCDCGRKFHYYCIQKKCKSQNRRFCDQCMIDHQGHKRWTIFSKLNISISPNIPWIIKEIQNLRDKIIQDIRAKAHQIQQEDQNYHNYLNKTKQKIQEAIEKHLLNDFITIYQNQSDPQLSWKIIDMLKYSYGYQTEIFKLIEKAQQLQKFYGKDIKLDLKEKYMQDIIRKNLSKFRDQLMELLQDDQLLEIQIQKLKSLSPFCDECTKMIKHYQLKDQYGEQYANKKKLLMKWNKEVQIFEKTHQKMQQIPLQQQSGQQQIERMIEMKKKELQQHLNQQKKSWISLCEKLLHSYDQMLEKKRPTSNDYLDILQKNRRRFLEMKQKTYSKMNSVLFENCQYQPSLIMEDNQIKFQVKRENKNLSPASVFRLFDKLLTQNPYVAINLAETLINEPITQSEVEQNQKIRVRLLEVVQQNPDSIQNCILLLAKFLQNQNQKVFISSKSSVKSQLTIRALSTGFLQNYIKCQQIIDDQDEECPYSFNQLVLYSENLQNFEAWYRMKIQRDTGIDGSKIVFLRISRGSIKVQWATQQSDQLLAYLQQNPKRKRKLKLHPYFKQFMLSPQDFDIRGNMDYTSHHTLIDQRGGWPYYLPKKCKRYGIKVLDKFGGDIDWLKMDSNSKQWAVGFHGVTYPADAAFNNPDKTILQSIFQGLNTGQMLKAGNAQAYQYQNSMNDPQSKIGRGVYLSPHIYESLSIYAEPLKINEKSQPYKLVFQCRLNPSKIKVCSRQQYWVVNNSQDIRPYGIILMKESQYNYQQLKNQFKKSFTYEEYKEQIQQFINLKQKETQRSTQSIKHQ